jgi:LEA14-like dessication related protein
MRKNDRFIIIAGAIAVAYWFYSKGRALGNLVFTPGTVNSVTMTGGAPLLSLNISVQNTSSASLRIDSLAANVLSNGSLVGNVYNFSPVDIPADSQIYMPVFVKLEMIGLANDIITAIQFRSTTQKIQVRGSANVNGIQLPLSVDFAIGS